MKPFILLFLLLLPAVFSLYPADIIPLPGVFNPDSIALGENHIYITAFPTVYIYTLKDFKLIKQFGKKGEGPNEFNRFAVANAREDYLMLGDRNRVLFYTKAGDYIKEIKARSILYWGAVPLAKGFAGKSRVTEDHIQFENLNIYDSKLEKVNEVCRYRFFYQVQGGGKKCDAMAVRGLQFQVHQDKVFFTPGKDFIIDVFDQSGKKLHTIEHKYKKIKMTEADKSRYHDYFRTALPWKRMYQAQFKNEIYFPDHLPAIRTFIAADKKLYILTYEVKEGKSKFVILNLKGKLLKEVWVPFDQGDEWFHYSLFKTVSKASPNPTFTIKNSNIYRLMENQEEESWELHIAPIK
ncbi:MAG: hypothetical protein GY940_41650 [bacterium]|nr:hypothetical protein [bacterium]